MDQHFITRIVEAALLAASQPLPLAQLQALFPEDQPAPNGSIEQALEALREGCAERGVELVELASGFRFQVKADVHPWVARLWTERQTRYTRATLETLALIAYRQPITRGEIEQVRGVAVNSNIIKALEEREWIRVVGHRDVPGKPALFGTTKAFLDYFGLKRLDELPPLSELKDIGELEPQLQFDNVPGSGGKPISAGGIEAGAPPDDGDTASTPVPDTHDDEGATHQPTAPGPSEGDDTNSAGTDTGLANDGVDADAGVNAGSGADTDLDEREAASALRNESPEPPEAAPGMRAADENDHEQDNAVETTTVPELQAASQDEPELQKND